jgi:hypothetical protein
MDYVIEMLNITKIFPGIIANDNVSLLVKQGEFMLCWRKRCRKIYTDERSVRTVSAGKRTNQN